MDHAIRPFGFAVAAGLAALLLLSGCVGNPRITLNPQVSYSAEFTFKIDDYAIDGSTRHNPGKTRRDYETAGVSMVRLDRWGADRSYLIFPDNQKYAAVRPVERSRSMAILGFLIQEFGSAARAVGKERYEDKPVTIYRASGKAGAFDFWVTGDGLLVRLEGDLRLRGKSHRIEFRLSNIVMGPQEASHFELPKGLQRVQAGG